MRRRQMRLKKRLSNRAVKSKLLLGSRVVQGAWSIEIDKDDQVIIWPPEGAGFKTTLASLDGAISDFCYKSAMPMPGKFNTSVKPSKVSDPNLGTDTSTQAPFKTPKIRQRDDNFSNLSNPALGQDTESNSPFRTPGINKGFAPNLGKGGLPNTDLGADSTGREPNFRDKLVKVQPDGRNAGIRDSFSEPRVPTYAQKRKALDISENLLEDIADPAAWEAQHSAGQKILRAKKSKRKNAKGNYVGMGEFEGTLDVEASRHNTRLQQHSASTWEVSVGNIGTVYSGTKRDEALGAFYEYVDQSTSTRGRASGEDVFLLLDGEIHDEHAGTLDVEASRHNTRLQQRMATRSIRKYSKGFQPGSTKPSAVQVSELSLKDNALASDRKKDVDDSVNYRFRDKGSRLRRKAGPKIKEKWDDIGGYNRDLEAESAQELYSLVRGLGGEDVDWESLSQSQPAMPEETDLLDDLADEEDSGMPEIAARRQRSRLNRAKLRRRRSQEDTKPGRGLGLDRGTGKGRGKGLSLGKGEDADYECEGLGKSQVSSRTRRRSTDVEAVDEKAKKYYQDYFGEYGKALVKDVDPKKRKTKTPVREAKAAAVRSRVKANMLKRARNASLNIVGHAAELAAPPQATPAQPAPVKTAPAPSAPAATDQAPGAGDAGLLALGWTQEEVRVMTPEEKEKILQAALTKPGTQAAPTAPGGAPGSQDTRTKAPAAPAAPVDPAVQPAPKAPVAGRIMSRRLHHALQKRLAQEQLTPMQQAPTDPPAEALPEFSEAAPAATDVNVAGTEEQAFSILEDVRSQPVQATDAAGITIQKNKILAQRLMSELGMGMEEAKKLYGVSNTLKLFQ